MRRPLLFYLLLSICLLTACQSSEEDLIYQVLNRREEAFQKKDLSLYLSCISKAYRDKEEDFSNLEKRIGGYFKSFDQISYSSWDRSVQIDGETAAVIQQFHLEVKRGGQTNRYSGKEALSLRKEGRVWKIVKGL